MIFGARATDVKASRASFKPVLHLIDNFSPNDWESCKRKLYSNIITHSGANIIFNNIQARYGRFWRAIARTWGQPLRQMLSRVLEKRSPSPGAASPSLPRFVAFLLFLAAKTSPWSKQCPLPQPILYFWAACFIFAMRNRQNKDPGSFGNS